MDYQEGELDTQDSRYADRLELVFREYERTLDFELALLVIPMSDEERARLENDPDLQARVLLCEARAKEELAADLRSLARCANSEAVKLAAMKELGRTLYPKRFKETGQGSGMPNGGQQVVRYMLVDPEEVGA